MNLTFCEWTEMDSQRWADVLNQWAMYLWNQSIEIQHKYEETQSRLNFYQEIYEEWNQFKDKFEHFEQLVQKKGLYPLVYKKHLKQKLEQFKDIPIYIPYDIKMEHEIDPMWLLDLNDPRLFYQLYPFWYWIYELYQWKESLLYSRKYLDKQVRQLETLVHIQIPLWYVEKQKSF